MNSPFTRALFQRLTAQAAHTDKVICICCALLRACVSTSSLVSAWKHIFVTLDSYGVLVSPKITLFQSHASHIVYTWLPGRAFVTDNPVTPVPRNPCILCWAPMVIYGVHVSPQIIILVPGNAHIVMLVPHGINVSPKILVYQSPGSINPRYCQYDIHVPPKIPFFQWPENQIVFAVPLWHPWSPKIRSNRYPEFVMIGCYGVHVPPKMRLFLCKEIQISYDCFL